MTEPLLAWAIAAFVALAAISMLMQALATARIYRTVREMQQQVSPLIPQAEATLESARRTLAESQAQMKEISTRAIAILDSTRTQLARVEEVVLDASARAKNQLERTEMVVEDTVTRVHETVAALHNGVLKPIKEVNGLAAGVRAGVLHLLKGQRPNVDRATQDEEMFI